MAWYKKGYKTLIEYKKNMQVWLTIAMRRVNSESQQTNASFLTSIHRRKALLYSIEHSLPSKTLLQVNYERIHIWRIWPRGDSKIHFECSKNIFQHGKRNFVSPSDQVMFCLLYKYQLYKYYSEIVSTLTKAPLRKARIIV